MCKVFVRIRQALPVLAVLLCGLSTALFTSATTLHPNAEKLKTYGNSRITISRFSSRSDFNSDRTLEWHLENGRYKEGTKARARTIVGAHDCESILSEQQYFALDKMASTSYISAQDVQ